MVTLVVSSYPSTTIPNESPTKIKSIPARIVEASDASSAALMQVIAAHQARGGMAVIATHHDLPLQNLSVLRLGPA